MFKVTDLMIKVIPDHGDAMWNEDVWMSDCPKHSDSCGCSRSCSGCTHSRTATSMQSAIEHAQHLVLAELKADLHKRLTEIGSGRALVN